MEIEPLEVYARDSNFAVVKPPGRNYPGAVIQGDSLASLCRTAIQLARQIDALPNASNDLRDCAEEVADALLNRVLHYQSVLDAHNIDYPHVHALSEADRIKLTPDGDD